LGLNPESRVVSLTECAKNQPAFYRRVFSVLGIFVEAAFQKFDLLFQPRNIRLRYIARDPQFCFLRPKLDCVNPPKAASEVVRLFPQKHKEKAHDMHPL